MGLFNKTQGQAQVDVSGPTSDQAALERAGKKQVLKVQCRPDLCHLQLPNCYAERMELLGRTRLCDSYFGYLGGYECAILCRIHKWRSSVSRLWLHCLCAGHSGDRGITRRDGFDVSPYEYFFEHWVLTEILALLLLVHNIIGPLNTLLLGHEPSLAGLKAGSPSVPGRQLSPLLLSCSLR